MLSDPEWEHELGNKLDGQHSHKIQVRSAISKEDIGMLNFLEIP